ncbi:hypothetical protein B0T11DRAFT_353907 [Plectosphaerella cucumerina]|uniref:Uncharacterized protein n=1 Tax=Plectosphaerella cucumerina TaxID=40658 RepID=A0A8K0X5K6_9PEZI|nr:hypothetical protein B0T11DRAFT_353907 [Plectosphaerella cucumerina]
MNPLDLIVNVPDDGRQTSPHCPELLFPDQDPSVSPPTSVSSGLDELVDFFSIQPAAGAGNIDSSSGTTSTGDDSLADEYWADGFNGYLINGFNGCFTDGSDDGLTDGSNEGCFSNCSAIELPSQSCQAPVGHWVSSDNLSEESGDIFNLICWGTSDSSPSSFPESPSATSDTSNQSPAESLEQCRSGDGSSPTQVGDSSHWSPLTLEWLSVHDIGCIMDEDDQLQPEESAPSPDTFKKDDDDDVVFLYEWTGRRPKRQQKSRRHRSWPLRRRRPSDSSSDSAPVTGALSKSRDLPKAHRSGKRNERRRSPTLAACDPGRWRNECFRLEKVGIHESGGQSVSEYTWMGRKRGWVSGRQARDVTDASQLSYVVVRRSSEGYGIKALWNTESGMFFGEDGINNKTVQLNRSEHVSAEAGRNIV